MSGSRIIIWRIVLFCAVWILGQKTIAHNDSTIASGNESVNLSPIVEFVLDTGNHQTLTHFLSSSIAENFIRSDKNTLNFGTINHPVWCKFYLRNLSDEASMLKITSTRINGLSSLYLPKLSGGYDEKEFSLVQKLSERDLELNTFVFKIPSNYHPDKPVYLRINATYLQFSIIHSGEKAFIESQHQYDHWIGFLFGGLIILFAYNLFIAISTKDKSYVYYVVYLATAIYYMAESNGILKEYLFANFGYVNGMNIGPGMCIITTVLFFNEFNNTKSFYPRIRTLLYWFCIPMGVVILASIFGERYWTQLLNQVWAGLLFLILTSVGLFISIRKKYKPTYYYMLAWFPHIILSLIYILAGANILPYNEFTSKGVHIGILLEAVLISFALGARINFLKKTKNKVQEVAFNRAKENEKMVREHNQQLETKIAARTEELRIINSRLEEALDTVNQNSELRTRFFNNIAHELRTPLTLMSGHMETMLGERFGGINENQRKSLLVARNNSKRLLEMISEILDLGKLESDKMELNSKPVTLKPLLDRIFYTFESLAHQFQIELDFKFDLPENTTLNIDSLKIEKVFNNLIHNAIKFTNRGGKVLLHVFEEGNDFLVKIVDNGIGIALSEQEKVFDRYFQTETLGPARGGTGIGLAIAREFMKLHKGQIKLESELGKGSEFILFFPKTLCVEPLELNDQYDQEEFKMEDLPVYPILSQRDKVILIVEDHREMQNYIKEVISPYSKVLIASDGIEALKILETNKVDLVTIDLMMPNMDGMNLLREIRKSPENVKMPTIMLTARTAEEDKLAALTIGVNDYISKPFSQNELLARIANLIENKLVREEIREDDTKGKEEEKTEENIFIESLRKRVYGNMDNSDYSIKELSSEMGMSDKHLTHIVKRITGLTPLKFIREIKLLYIQDQLRSKKITSVAEASYAIGIENPSHFTKLFTQRFGKNPSEYLS